jgi:hypothetical protein
MAFAMLAFASCKKEAPPPPRPPPVAEQPTPRADQALKEDDDPSWLLGTWKEDGKDAWLLFNPGEVAELAGKPVKVLRRGKLSVHGKYVSAIFPGGEVQLEGSSDRKELATDDIRHVYRRGAPP